MRDREDVGAENVGWPDAVVGADLEQRALEELDALAEEWEFARNRVAQRAHAAVVLEIVEDRRRRDAVARRGEEGRIWAGPVCLGSRERRLTQDGREKQRNAQRATKTCASLNVR